MGIITETGETAGAVEEVMVYSNVPHCPGKQPTELDAFRTILVNEAGEVYGGGRNFPKERSEQTNYTKVRGLDGDVKKIVVNERYCAALTNAGKLMVWKHSNIIWPDGIELRAYKLGERCSICDDDFADMYGLAYCNKCGMYQSGSKDSKTKCIAVSQNEGIIVCRICSNNTTKAIKTWDKIAGKSINVNVAFCSSCETFIYGLSYDMINMNCGHNNSVKTIRKHDERIKDVAFCGFFIVALSENNNLYCESTSTLSNIDPKLYDKLKVKDSGEIVAVYGGGRRTQLFVKYKNGSLMKSSDIGTKKTCDLRAIKLPAPVVKVCCGMDCAAVLLSDGAVWFITPDSTTYQLVHESGLKVFTDIAVIGNTDVYLVQAAGSTLGDGAVMDMLFHSEAVAVEFYESALNGALKAKIPPPHTKHSSSGSLPIQKPAMALLYGKSYLADMIIKLGDEALPAHCSILFAASSHFRKTFNADNPPPKVLDVSRFNAPAYKYLIQLYYQAQPDDLDAEGFAHLRHIAASYGETKLAEDATTKVKSLLNEDNVERIFALSKRFNFFDLTTECERIMRSQPFMEKLVEATMKNLASHQVANSEETDSWQLLTDSSEVNK